MRRAKADTNELSRSSIENENTVYMDGGIEVQGDLVKQTVLQSQTYAHGMVMAKARDYWYKLVSREYVCTVTAGCTFNVTNGISVEPGGYEYIKMDKAEPGIDIFLNKGQMSWTPVGNTKYKFLYKYQLDFNFFLHYGQIGMSCDYNAQVEADPDENAYL